MKARDFLLTKLYLLRKPKTNVQILQQNVLLKYKYLVHFLKQHAGEILVEVKHVYVETMSSLLKQAVAGHVRSLSELQMSSSTQKNEPLVSYEGYDLGPAVGRKGNPSPSGAIDAGYTLPSSPFALGTRVEVLDALETSPPVVVHTGVKEMADEFWPDVSPWVTSLPDGARMCFTGHSLGGSMAMLLMAWSKLRLGMSLGVMEPCWTFGSPPVLASDGWEMRKRRGMDLSETVARAAAGGSDWVGEIMRGVGMAGTTGGVTAFGADAGEGLGASPGPETDLRADKEAREDALRLAGFEADSVRAFVLSNDPVPRMWLAADPFFGAAASNETVAGLMSAREWLFGQGILSKGRFLYDAAGTLYWMRWSPDAGTSVTVHRGDPDALCEELAMAPPWGSVDDDGEEERSWLDAGVSSVAGAMDHNAQNYVDSIQYLNVRRFTGSSSKAL